MLRHESREDRDPRNARHTRQLRRLRDVRRGTVDTSRGARTPGHGVPRSDGDLVDHTRSIANWAVQCHVIPLHLLSDAIHHQVEPQGSARRQRRDARGCGRPGRFGGGAAGHGWGAGGDQQNNGRQDSSHSLLSRESGTIALRHRVTTLIHSERRFCSTIPLSSSSSGRRARRASTSAVPKSGRSGATTSNTARAKARSSGVSTVQRR